MGTEDAIGRAFIAQAVDHLQLDFLPRIKKCVELLSDEDFWWRSSEVENSVGNLILHLSGNVRQWIVSGLGGEPDTRHRFTEFAARHAVAKGDALTRLEETVSEAVRVLQSLSAADLLQAKTIQGFHRSGLQAVFHVIEHFSYHTGQIVFVTKLRRRQDLKFYDL
jgi:uncharacterized damage-inducible protein DinB